MGQISSREDQRAFTESDLPSVLCIDDDPDIPRSIQQILSGFEVNVSAGYFGQQGIWESICKKPDLIITDLAMPNGTGEDLLACLKRRAETQDIPVIVLTGNRDSQTQRQLQLQGAAAVLFKPAPITTLLTEVSRHIELRQVAD